MDLQDQGVIDSGCSRHMTGNMSYLTDYKEIDGGYVAFGGNPKGGKITKKVIFDLWLELVSLRLSLCIRFTVLASISLPDTSKQATSLIVLLLIERISIFIVNTFVSLGCSGNITRIMRRTLKIFLVFTV
ncbi:hypothetical protein Tco_1259631 [Tanacetum coccineum]